MTASQPHCGGQSHIETSHRAAFLGYGRADSFNVASKRPPRITVELSRAGLPFMDDCHFLLWHVRNNERRVFIWMVEHGRSSITAVSTFLAAVDADPRSLVVPLDRPVLERSLPLTGINEMHDRLIVATALHLAASGLIILLTRDGNIRPSGLIPVVW